MPGFISRDSDLVLKPPISRIYVNVHPGLAAWFVGDVGDELESADVPFRMKTPNHPSRYYRSDTGVIYVSSAQLNAAVDCLARTQVVHEVVLRKEKPILTMPLARGVSVADEPDDQRALGERLSHGLWVATLVWRSLDDELHFSVNEFLASIARSGRSLGMPHLRSSENAVESLDGVAQRVVER